MISGHFPVKWEDVEHVPISQYQEQLEQAINQMNFRAGGKFEMQTGQGKQETLSAKYKRYQDWLRQRDAKKKN